ncbi:DUF2239 family protein [Xenophilus azovorans]|uniref:DUF2239 family protein n=1 Tax=Xenophilus azovorans TaxID=151755 RepID=UPI00068FF47B|nr:DUF2239 family protein [Xenophilus azovorans]
MSDAPSFLTAFLDFDRIASGDAAQVMASVRQRPDAASVFVFDDRTGERLDLDLRPDSSDAAAPAEEAPRGVGRPRLGVVAREVTLLPRHWDWLSRQPGGASVALRRLIDEARRNYAERDSVRAAREAAYRFMTVMAGDLPGFEEAARALFAGERERFQAQIEGWPEDVAAYAQKLAAPSWAAA